MSDGRVEYEIRGDYSNLNRDLNEAERQIQQSSQIIQQNSDRISTQIQQNNNEVSSQIQRNSEQISEQVRRNSNETSEEVQKNSESTGSKIKSVCSTISKGIMGASVAVAGLTVALGTKAVTSAVSLDKAVNQLTASLGLTTEETEKYEEIVKSIYADNFGESFEDIANNIAIVRQQMQGLTNEELKNITESAYLLADVYEIDMQESIRGANSLMNQFGVTAEEAYNLLAQGAEKGLNQNGDLADQLAEYSTYYANLGFSAEEAFNMMSTAVKDGVFQLDYINDAIKEFGIRAIDGSETTAEGMALLGLDAEKLAEEFAKGGDSAKNAFSLVLNELNNCDDEIARNTAGVDLFGTKWEDLGESAILSLADVEQSIDLTRDKLTEMNEVKYDDLGSVLEGLGRQIELLIIPLGKELIPIISDIVEKIAPVIEEYLPILIDYISPIIDVILQLIDEILPVLMELIEELLPPVQEIITSLMPVLLNIMDILLPLLVTLIQALEPILNLFIALLEPIGELITVLLDLINIVLKPLIPIIEVVADVISDMLGGAIEFITGRISIFKDILSGIIDFIVGVFTGDWEKAWNGVSKIFSNIWNSLVSTAENVVNRIIGVINSFIDGINSLLGWAGVNITPITKVDWTSENAKEQLGDALENVVGGVAKANTKTKNTTTKSYNFNELNDISLSGSANSGYASNYSSSSGVKASDYKYVPKDDDKSNSTKLSSSSGINNNTKTTTSTNNSSNNSGGNTINITSFIPTVWDNADTANQKLIASGIAESLVGNSASSKIISGLAQGVENTALLSPEDIADATLNDVVTAIKELETAQKETQYILDVVLKTDSYTLAKATVQGINQIKKQTGKLPF